MRYANVKCSSDEIKKLGPPNPNLDSMAATEEGSSFKVKTKNRNNDSLPDVFQ